jgi:galactokinase
VTRAWRAPGRVNLIGEHTDYNEGFVLPFALELGCTATVTRLPETGLRISSAQEDEIVAYADLAGSLTPRSGGWAGYAAGVVWALREDGHRVPGLEIVLDSDVPLGSGLSSSAAIVCSVATAVCDEAGLDLSPAELLRVTRRAENDFVGAPTGGMDQLASLRAIEGHALFCDMRTLETEPIPFPLGGLTLVVVDTKAPHRHADGEYRRRREGCEAAARELGVRALRDVADAELDAALERLSGDELRRYVRHIVTEDARVLDVVDLLRRGDVAAIGPVLTASHASMRNDFEITVPEIDTAVESLLGAGALGARMTGGGFGGCVIGLLRDADVGAAIAAVEDAYQTGGWTAPAWFAARPAAGAHPVDLTS